MYNPTSFYFSPRDEQSYKRINEKTVIWDITKTCNLKCIHCYNSERYSASDEDLVTSEFKEYMDTFSKWGVKHLHFLGGEPLIRNDLIELIKHAKSKNIKVTLNTNGTLVTDKRSKELIESGIDQIAFSLDGATPKTNDYIRGNGTYEKVISGIKTLKQAAKSNQSDLQIGIAFTMTSINLNELSQVIEVGIENEVDVIDFQEYYSSGRALTHKGLSYSRVQVVDALEELMKYISENQERVRRSRINIQVDTWYPTAIYLERKYRTGLTYNPKNISCSGGVRIIYVDSIGKIHPCGITNNPIYNKGPISDGLLKLQGFTPLEFETMEDLNKSPYFRSFFNLRGNKSKNQDKEPCHTCEYRNLCVFCPFLHYNDYRIGECAEALRRDRDFESLVENTFPVIKDDRIKKMDGGYKVFDEKYNRYRSVLGTGSFILRGIEESQPNVSVKDLIDSVQLTFPNTDRRQVERDTIDFVWWLYLLHSVQLLKPNTH